MELLAFKAARMWIQSSRSSTKTLANLPTPFQYGLALKLASRPGLPSVWSYIQYTKFLTRMKLPRFVSLLGNGLVAQVFLAFLTTGADVWLHVASTTVLFEESTPLSSNSSSLSRVLIDICTSDASEYQTDAEVPSCVYGVSPSPYGGGGIGILYGAAEGLSTLNNLSTRNNVVVTNGIALITARAPDALDFNATSYGLQSQCTPISVACGFAVNSTDGLFTPYDCGSLYPGVQNNGSSGFFEVGMNLTIVSPEGDNENFGTYRNPFQAAVEITVDTLRPIKVQNDSEFVAPVEGNIAILLWCEVVVLDVMYSISGGEVKILQQNHSSNITTFPFSATIGAANGNPAIQQPLWLAAELDATSGNSSKFADLFSADMSRIGIAMAAGLLNESATLAESNQASVFVSRLPKPPLYLLVGSLFSYALLSISIAIFASPGWKIKDNDNNDVEVIQERLADPLGIVQECFGGDVVLPSSKARKWLKYENLGLLGVRPRSSDMERIKVLELFEVESTGLLHRRLK